MMMQDLEKAATFLEIFGIMMVEDPSSGNLMQPQVDFQVNQPLNNGNYLLRMIKQQCFQLDAGTVMNKRKHVETKNYKDHYLMANQAK